MRFRANKKETIRALSAVVHVTALIAIALVMPAQAQTNSDSSGAQKTQSTSQSSTDGATDYTDEVILKNGSVIKGTIVYVESDSLVLESDSFDPITISVWDIRSIKTTNVVDVTVDSGENWRGKISTNTKGEMIFEPEGGGKVRPLNFGFVDGIYHLRPAWNNKMTIGGSQTTGSADVLGFSISGTSTRDSEEHRLTLLSQLTYAEANGELVEDNWSGTAKYDYFFRPRLYLAVAEELRHDKFKDLKLRTVTSGSLGHSFVRKPETLFEVEVGIGVMTERFYKAPDDNFLALRTGVNSKMAIGDKATITDVLVIYLSDGADRVQGVNTFKFDLELTDRWGLEIANIINHYSGPSFVSTDDADIKWTVGVSSTF
jgi:putative salt-induced outer membrane protein YdiY